MLLKKRSLMKNIQKDVIAKNLDAKRNIVNVIKLVSNADKDVNVKVVLIVISLRIKANHKIIKI